MRWNAQIDKAKELPAALIESAGQGVFENLAHMILTCTPKSVPNEMIRSGTKMEAGYAQEKTFFNRANYHEIARG
ncbi:MAG: hypothetical protein DWQ07_01295 [Chloroflexi bacterium]|nr:MAG: hypothetical protein DWQ07_01295 [Chloroflexota bacterium]MBL1193867.1 hypothetical protein [Chloroflexota bacterium]NOH11161.1 hypothetical protein [Chloroflexota bacterium]